MKEKLLENNNQNLYADYEKGLNYFKKANLKKLLPQYQALNKDLDNIFNGTSKVSQRIIFRSLKSPSQFSYNQDVKDIGEKKLNDFMLKIIHTFEKYNIDINTVISEQISPGEQAKKLGLHHVGYGKYADNNNQIKYISKDDKLQPIQANDISNSNKKLKADDIEIKKSKKDGLTFDSITGPKNKKDSISGNPKAERDVVGILKLIVQRAKAAKEKNEKLPEYDLCKATIPGTNLFCTGNKGIERKHMPQLIGQAVPGSIADKLPKDKKGEIDTTDLFKKALEKNGIKMTNEKVNAMKLKATQNQLVGDKVASMVNALIDKPEAETAGIRAPIFVSKDGYILDGHHRWAALVGLDLANGGGPNVDMDVIAVDMNMEKLLNFSNQFCDKIGLQQKAATANAIKKEAINFIKQTIFEILNETTINSTEDEWLGQLKSNINENWAGGHYVKKYFSSSDIQKFMKMEKSGQNEIQFVFTSHGPDNIKDRLKELGKNGWKIFKSVIDEKNSTWNKPFIIVAIIRKTPKSFHDHNKAKLEKLQSSIKKPKSELLKDQIKEFINKKTRQEDGTNFVTKDITVYIGNQSPTSVEVYFDLTFRRNSHVGAYQTYSQQINTANNLISEFESKFKTSKVLKFTKEDARSKDNTSESNGDNPYSEYEQSLNAYINITGVK